MTAKGLEGKKVLGHRMIGVPRLQVCARDRIRTYDLLLRRQTLYPLSYAGEKLSNCITRQKAERVSDP